MENNDANYLESGNHAADAGSAAALPAERLHHPRFPPQDAPQEGCPCPWCQALKIELTRQREEAARAPGEGQRSSEAIHGIDPPQAEVNDAG